MAWVEIRGRRVWSGDRGRKYCRECGVVIPKPKDFKKLSGAKRAAFTNTKFCSKYCRYKFWWNSVDGILRRRSYRRTKEYKIRFREYQKKYRRKWRDKVNERRRLKRLHAKQLNH